jgi:hypothetical protein
MILLRQGDFIFYSVLVSKAALYSFTSFAACMLTILFGLGSTLVLLSVHGKALPGRLDVFQCFFWDDPSKMGVSHWNVVAYSRYSTSNIHIPCCPHVYHDTVFCGALHPRIAKASFVRLIVWCGHGDRPLTDGR